LPELQVIDENVKTFIPQRPRTEIRREARNLERAQNNLRVGRAMRREGIDEIAKNPDEPLQLRSDELKNRLRKPRKKSVAKSKFQKKRKINRVEVGNIFNTMKFSDDKPYQVIITRKLSRKFETIARMWQRDTKTGPQPYLIDVTKSDLLNYVGSVSNRFKMNTETRKYLEELKIIEPKR